VILHGTMDMEIDGIHINTFTAPALLGERAMLQSQCMNFATVRCDTFCECLRVPTARAKAILETHPDDAGPFNAMMEVNAQGLLNLTSQAYLEADALKSMRPTARRSTTGARRGRSPRPAKDEAGQGVEQEEEDDEDEDGLLDSQEEMFKAVLAMIFKDSSPGFCDFLAQGMERAIYWDGQCILKEGDEGNTAIVIQRGTGVVEVGGVRVGEVKEGSLIGEAALLREDAVRTATVRAVGIVTAFALAREAVLEALEVFPSERDQLEAKLQLREQANKVLARPKETSVNKLDVESPKPARRGSAFASGQTRRVSTRASAAAGHSSSGRRESMMVTAHDVTRSAAAALTQVSRASCAIGKFTSGVSRQSRVPRRAVTVSTRMSIAATEARVSMVASGEGDDDAASRASAYASERTNFSEDDKDMATSVSADLLVVPALPAPRAPAPHGRDLAWARRRREATLAAAERRRQASDGFGGVVPPSFASEATASSCSLRSRPLGESTELTQSRSRLSRARRIYEPRVWHEVFGK